MDVRSKQTAPSVCAVTLLFGRLQMRVRLLRQQAVLVQDHRVVRHSHVDLNIDPVDCIRVRRLDLPKAILEEPRHPGCVLPHLHLHHGYFE